MHASTRKLVLSQEDLLFDLCRPQLTSRLILSLAKTLSTCVYLHKHRRKGQNVPKTGAHKERKEPVTPRLAWVPAISHQPPQRLCNVCCTRPTDVWDECQWGSSLLLLLFFVGSWSLSNIWTPPPPHSLKTNPALNALKRKKSSHEM